MTRLTLPVAIFNSRTQPEGDLFRTVTMSGQLYEIASIGSSTAVRLMKLTGRQARWRRFGAWLERRGIRF